MGEHAEWAKSHPATHGRAHRPIALYGDDAALSKHTGEKMLIFTLADVLDHRKNCMEAVYPLFVMRMVPLLTNWTCVASTCNLAFTFQIVHDPRRSQLGMRHCKPTWVLNLGRYNLPNLFGLYKLGKILATLRLRFR